ncbi:MAG: hypothetical protein GY795_26540 [Desulfobacterales bacterium]|nr:hypothetical protein [Desulfobacterales bacterium]
MSKKKRKKKITLASIIGFAIGLSIIGAGAYIVVASASAVYTGYIVIGLGICMMVLIFCSL